MGSCYQFSLGPRMNTREADVSPNLSKKLGPARPDPQPEAEPQSQVHQLPVKPTDT